MPRETNSSLRTELDLAYMKWVHRPGEFLSVLDNASDLVECIRRTGANATTLGAVLKPIPASDGQTGAGNYVADPLSEQLEHQKSIVTDTGAHFSAYLGEWNNPWFMRFPDNFVRDHPEAWMRDRDGKRVELRRNTKGDDEVIPVTAVDDPTILALSADLIRSAAASLLETGLVAAWVMGAEESYPELFGLPASDFRPAFLSHFNKWLDRWLPGSSISVAEIELDPDNPAYLAWFRFREQAMADRAACYMQAFLDADCDRPVFYPTHGNLFLRNVRLALAQPPSLMAAATDGMEMGHITIDDDDERLNPLVNAHFGSFGKPLINPRLANKTLDSKAKGGGKSFTPQMLRRLVYECVGQGVWHIGPIHWTSILHDGEWAIKDTPAQEECAKVFAEIKECGWLLNGMARLQPQIGLFVSDETWLESWNLRWTGAFQDALSLHWNVSVVSDAAVDGSLAAKTPLLVSIDNSRISTDAMTGLATYLDAGGHLIIAGEFQSSGGEELSDQTRAIREHPNTLKVEDPALLPTRTLTNEVHNGDGAFVLSGDYDPIDMQYLSEQLGTEFPSVLTTPVSVTGDGSADVNAFVLTDRASLLAVVINNADSARSVRVATATEFAMDSESWCCSDGLTSNQLSESSSCQVDLEPFGTRLIWIHPLSDSAAADVAAAKALESIQRWERDRFDLEALRFLAIQLEGAEELHPAKKFSLALAVQRTVSLRCEATVDTDAKLRVTTDASGSDGEHVAGADVTLRIVPGAPRPAQLQESENGRYGVTIARDDLPHFYNAQTQRYEPVSGAVRLVLSLVANDGRQGGAIVNMDL